MSLVVWRMVETGRCLYGKNIYGKHEGGCHIFLHLIAVLRIGWVYSTL